MKISQLLEARLDRLARKLELRSTESKISDTAAEIVLDWLDARGYKIIFSDGAKAGEDKKPIGRPYLKINSSTWKNKAWRSGKGAVERSHVYNFLRDMGYKVAGLEAQVRDNINDANLPWTKNAGNTPHIYFW